MYFQLEYNGRYGCRFEFISKFRTMGDIVADSTFFPIKVRWKIWLQIQLNFQYQYDGRYFCRFKSISNINTIVDIFADSNLFSTLV